MSFNGIFEIWIWSHVSYWRPLFHSFLLVSICITYTTSLHFCLFSFSFSFLFLNIYTVYLYICTYTCTFYRLLKSISFRISRTTTSSTPKSGGWWRPRGLRVEVNLWLFVCLSICPSTSVMDLTPWFLGNWPLFHENPVRKNRFFFRNLILSKISNGILKGRVTFFNSWIGCPNIRGVKLDLVGIILRVHL